MRAPLSWLCDFAPFDRDPAELARTLDDLGLVVEGIERIGEGLDDIVVARIEDIAPIAGADRIRLVSIDAGDGTREIVCGATNFSVGDLVPLAPVGAVLPGGFTIGRRKLKGVTSDGMLCSGKELGLSDDTAGLLLVTQVEGARPGVFLAELLDIESDVVFDITVEGSRPDAWSMTGIARDLAARLKLPFAIPEPQPRPTAEPGNAPTPTVEVLDPDLCPRFTAKSLAVDPSLPSPRWIARRLTLAGMRPVNPVVDASNYVMLELGQPTHPYDLDRLGSAGLLVRRARPGETLTTLDGVERTLGVPGRGLGDTGEDCLICDAEGTPVGIGGIIGGRSSEISETTTRVLLEAAYFTPMAIARTSKRLGLRTEASVRFERGCDPWGIDRAMERFCELVGAVHVGAPIDVRGDVPRAIVLQLPVERVNGVLGTAFSHEEVAALIEPIGFGCEPTSATPADPTPPGETNAFRMLTVTVPTNRPDVRPAPHGIDDVIEEVARTYGYSRLPRRRPAWPEPGGLTDRQRDRRAVCEVMCGLGASEAWTPTLVSDADHVRLGLVGPSVAVANPMVHDEAFLRRSMLPGLLRAVGYNVDRRQGAVRFFEVGTVFTHPSSSDAGSSSGRVVERAGASGANRTVLPCERELLSVVFAGDGDDATAAVGAWRVLVEAMWMLPRVVTMVADESLSGLHPTRSARLVVASTGAVVGAVGEVDPALVAEAGSSGRIGWLEIDLGVFLDRAVVGRRPETAQSISRFPSSDVDVALVVADEIPADRVADILEAAAGELLESISLFDVFRGSGIGEGRRSLTFRLRFCADDRTLTDEEVGALRLAVIGATGDAVGAVLR